jgi:hypothetical protein
MSEQRLSVPTRAALNRGHGPTTHTTWPKIGEEQRTVGCSDERKTMPTKDNETTTPSGPGVTDTPSETITPTNLSTVELPFRRSSYAA